MVQHKLVSFVIIVALLTLVPLLIKLIGILLKWKHIQGKNYAILATMMGKRSYFVKKVSSRSPGLDCSFRKGSILITEISVFATEISVTGSARLLVCRTQVRIEVRSRKSSQRG